MSIQARSRSGWNNLTCNPLNLFANSLFQSQEDANKDFEKCIVNLSAATTTYLFQKEVETQNEVLTNMTNIQTNYSDLTKKVGEYTQDVSDANTEHKTQVEDIKKSQKVSNDLSDKTGGFVNQYMIDLQTIFNNITSYFFQK